MKKRFEVTIEHILLLQHFNIVWQDINYGVPTVSAPEPYGSQDVYTDMEEILGVDPDRDGHHEQLEKLHRDMEIVLQILIHNCRRGIKQGKYELYQDLWRKIIT